VWSLSWGSSGIFGSSPALSLNMPGLLLVLLTGVSTPEVSAFQLNAIMAAGNFVVFAPAAYGVLKLGGYLLARK
jgi:hypothetical protein